MNFKKPILYILLIAFPVAMFLSAPYDLALYHYLGDLEITWVEELTGRTLFEGELPGASDPAKIFLISILGVYIYANTRRASDWFKTRRPFFGFILSAGFIGGVLSTHVLKWFMARARPKQVMIKQIVEFTEWYEIGPKYITDGVYRGSFPSGHTSIVVLFMTLAYAFSCGTRSTPATVLKSASVCLIVLAYSAFMVIGRTMDRMHWMTDCLFSIFLVLLVIHVMYHWVLRVPERMEKARNGLLEPPDYWELKFSLWAALLSASVLAVGLGGRAFFEMDLPWLAVLIPAGAYGAYVAYKKMTKLRSRALEGHNGLAKGSGNSLLDGGRSGTVEAAAVNPDD